MRAITYIFIFLMFALMGCDKEESWDCVKKSGKTISEFRHLGFFDAVKAEGRMDILYRYAEAPFVEVVFGKNVISDITTKVENGFLIIKNETKCNWVRNLSKVPKVIIYGSDFRYFENKISGDIVFEDTLATPIFKYEQWDSNGDIDMTFNTHDLSIFVHTGYSEISLHGNSTIGQLFSGSVSTFDASDLRVQHLYVNNTSTYDMECYSDFYLYGAIYQTGNIFYGGNPQIIDTEIEGSGQVLPY